MTCNLASSDVNILAYFDYTVVQDGTENLIMPRNKMAEGYKEFTLSVCVCMCVFQIRVRHITSLCMVGFKNYLAQMIIKTRQRVACKNHIARSKVKGTVGSLSFWVLKSCPTHNFIMHGRI